MKTASLHNTTSPILGAIANNILAIGIGVTLLTAGKAQAFVLIDDFTYLNPDLDPLQAVVTPFDPTMPDISDFVENPDSYTSIIGGYRDLQIIPRNGGADTGTHRATGVVYDGELTFSNDQQFQSDLIATWDGQNSSGDHTINYTGLGGVDLRADGADGILFDRTNDQGLTMTLSIYTDSTHFSTVILGPLSEVPSTNSPKPAFFAFGSCLVGAIPCASFRDQGTNGSGGGADFHHVGAIQLLLNGPTALDTSINFIRADKDPNGIIVPEPTSVISLLAFGTLGAGSMRKQKLKQKSDKQKTEV